jgi:hypothetical protein
MNLFQRATQRLPLTPGERAFLKALQTLCIGALISVLVTASQLLVGEGNIDWQKTGYILLLTFLFSLGHGIAKYFTAQGDAPLGQALEQVTSAVERRSSLTSGSVSEQAEHPTSLSSP